MVTVRSHVTWLFATILITSCKKESWSQHVASHDQIMTCHVFSSLVPYNEFTILRFIFTLSQTEFYPCLFILYGFLLRSSQIKKWFRSFYHTKQCLCSKDPNFRDCLHKTVPPIFVIQFIPTLYLLGPQFPPLKAQVEVYRDSNKHAQSKSLVEIYISSKKNIRTYDLLIWVELGCS